MLSLQAHLPVVFAAGADAAARPLCVMFTMHPTAHFERLSSIVSTFAADAVIHRHANSVDALACIHRQPVDMLVLDRAIDPEAAPALIWHQSTLRPHAFLLVFGDDAGRSRGGTYRLWAPSDVESVLRVELRLRDRTRGFP